MIFSISLVVNLLLLVITVAKERVVSAPLLQLVGIGVRPSVMMLIIILISYGGAWFLQRRTEGSLSPAVFTLLVTALYLSVILLIMVYRMGNIAYGATSGA